ncbi:hypothetical protein HII31_06134 [Pseudocercospora fuligena]|uniref:Uncharacterized protein n=1 Tax=Pseudocercospora fuligena TaxID=685502 RepID=A0A8H6RK02_9PEZI|nr:hypothetical protein HII31_06134 [Pseudocercospora fuligena]
MSKPVVYVPVKLDAFVLNQSSSKGYPDNASVAPISQPNYTFLRLDAGLVQNDVLSYHDIAHAAPASVNPRLTDLGTGQPKTRRQGVYLHWMLPRCYRSGTTTKTDSDRVTAPTFKTAPDRWLVVRKLHPGAEPVQPTQDGRVKELTAWIVESNRLRNVQDLGREVDIEVECSPFLQGDGSLTSLDGQAEIYIGQKTQLPPNHQWKETAPDPNSFTPLGTLNSANPLFADYIPHNMNVFSMLDNFEYADGQKKACLTKATASYYVIGWHGEVSQDPLSNTAPIMSDLLSQNFLSMELAKDSRWLSSHEGGRVMCHGAMYAVNYTAAESKTMKQPAAAAARKLSNKDSHPVTVGTTPLDSVLSYVRAYNDAKREEGDRDSALEQTQIDLLHLETLLTKQEDDIDAQQEARDMLSANNFEPFQDSGSSWNFSAAEASQSSSTTSKKSATSKLFEPIASQRLALKKLNDAQAALDGAKRELKHERWNLFSLWWKFVSDRNWQVVGNKISEVPGGPQTDPKQLVQTQVGIVRELQQKSDNLALVVQSYLEPFRKPASANLSKADWPYIVQRGSQARFYTQRDPSMLVPGLLNPWPRDWLDPAAVRLATQVKIPDIPSALPSGWQSLKDTIEKVVGPCFPALEMRVAASALVREFFNLCPVDARAKEALSSIRGADPPTVVPPQYHDSRDVWNNTQAWFPLFVEWEIRYHHLPWDAWDFQQVPSFLPNEISRIRYGIKPDKVVAEVAKRNGKLVEREIDGRVLILPQPGYSLRVSVEQLLKATNEEDLPESLRRKVDPITKSIIDPQKQFLAAIDQIQMLSAPMTGFMDHLVTRLQGTHIKPTFRDPKNPDMDGGKPGVLPAAVIDPGHTGLDKATIELMGSELDKTPFSDFVAFDDGVAPFRPVTHGQFRFSKLNVIDKFGQCISAIEPRPTNKIDPLYPNLSEYFHPQSFAGSADRDNVVIEDPAGCQFAQYPPAINQDARLNSHFMLFDNAIRMWRPCGDWDDPVWAYVVLNYAENGVQIFLPDGRFYREVRLGGKPKTDGAAAATESLAWQPFEPPKDSNGKYMVSGSPQLDALMKQLSDPEYLRSFFRMVNNALAALPHTPNQYAEYLNAIVGRPLALTNVGFSLELATPAYKNQSTLSNTLPDVPLSTVKGQPSGYSFPIKIGDRDRAYDGLVCLFDQKGNAYAVPGNELDLSTMITYYPSGKHTTTLDRKQYFELRPYHLSTRSYGLDQRLDPKTPVAFEQKISQLNADHYDQISMFGALIDPFAKIHAYSGILPITTLQLPSWSLQNAMQRMTAFFRMGPLVITTPDLQRRYDPARRLSVDYNLEQMDQKESALTSTLDQKTAAFTGVPLPALASASWNWLQPYAVPSQNHGSNEKDNGPTPNSKEQLWNPFTVATLDNRPKYEAGPYTAVEGFLQLKRPIVEDKLP